MVSRYRNLSASCTVRLALGSRRFKWFREKLGTNFRLSGVTVHVPMIDGVVLPQRPGLELGRLAAREGESITPHGVILP